MPRARPVREEAPRATAPAEEEEEEEEEDEGQTEEEEGAHVGRGRPLGIRKLL